MKKSVFVYNHCTRKIRYKNEKRAKISADAINKRYEKKVCSYFCKICEGWHNGHPSKTKEVK